jgi:hypothetical protein
MPPSGSNGRARPGMMVIGASTATSSFKSCLDPGRGLLGEHRSPVTRARPSPLWCEETLAHTIKAQHSRSPPEVILQVSYKGLNSHDEITRITGCPVHPISRSEQFETLIPKIQGRRVRQDRDQSLKLLTKRNQTGAKHSRIVDDVFKADGLSPILEPRMQKASPITQRGPMTLP